VVVLNKLDLVDADEAEAGAELLADFGLPTFAVSARPARAPGLVDLLFELVPEAPTPVPAAEPAARVAAPEPLRVTRDASGLGWVVHGRELEAWWPASTPPTATPSPTCSATSSRSA
jgi:hypothetical protein